MAGAATLDSLTEVVSKVGESMQGIGGKVDTLQQSLTKGEARAEKIEKDLIEAGVREKQMAAELVTLKANLAETSEMLRKASALMAHGRGSDAGMQPYRSPRGALWPTENLVGELACLFSAWGAAGDSPVAREAMQTKFRKLADKRYPIAAQALSSADKDGMALWIPEEIMNALIRNVETHGHFEANADVQPMSSNTKGIPKDGDELTVYYPEDNEAVTESEPTGDMKYVYARTYATLTKMSEAVEEDSIIDLGGYLGDKIVFAHAKATDTNGFTGNGESTKARVVGALYEANVATHILGNTIGASLTNTGKDTFGELAYGDLVAMQGLLPTPARAGAKWYMHRYVASIVKGITDAAGNGILQADILSQGRQFKLFGDPVIEVDVMPSATAVTTDFILYGDLRLAYMLGRRRAMTIIRSREAGFANIQLWIRSHRRIGIAAKDGTQLVKARTSTT